MSTGVSVLAASVECSACSFICVLLPGIVHFGKYLIFALSWHSAFKQVHLPNKRGVARPKHMVPGNILKNNNSVSWGDQRFGSLRAITEALTLRCL